MELNNNENLLLISESEEIKSKLKTSLLSFGFQVRLLNSLEKKMEIIKGSDIDLIIMDINQDPRVAIEKAKFIWDQKDLPLLFILSGIPKSSIDQFSLEGVYEVIEMPFTERDLIITCLNLFSRSHLEYKIRETEKRYQDLYDNAPDMYFTIEPNGIITSVNHYGSQYLGYDKDELIGKPIWSVVYDDDIQSVKERISEVFHRKQKSEELEFRKISKSGNIIWVQERMQIIYDQENNPVELRVICRDVSERKKAQQELFEREEKYRGIYENLLDVYFELSLDGIIIEISPSISRISDYSQEDLLGRSVYEFYLLPPERENFLERIKQKEILENLEIDFKNKDGEILHCQINSRLYRDEKDQPLKIIGFIKDITSKKQLEQEQITLREQLRILFETIPDAIFIKDKSLRYTAVNAAMEKMFGMKNSEMKGRHDIEIFGIEKGEKIRKEDLQVLNGATIKIEENLTIKGVSKTYNIVKVPLMDENKNVVGICGFARDLTKLKQKEAELQESEIALSTLLENSPDYVFYLDRNLKIKVLNRDCTGKTKEEILNHDFIEFIRDEDKNKIEDILKKILSNGKKTSTEFTASAYLGERYFSTHISPIYLSGEMSGLVVTCSDISEYKRSLNLQNIIYEIAETVNTSKDLTEIFGLIKQILSRILDTKNFYIALYQRENNTITLPYIVDEYDKFKSFPAGKTLTSYVIKTGKSLLATRKKIDELVSKGEVETIGTISKIWMGVPLKIKSEIIGVVCLQSYVSDSAFTERDLNLLEYVSDNIALAIERKRANEELKISRRNFSEISNTITDAFWIRDYKTKKFIFTNKAFKNIYEVDPDKIVQDPDLIEDFIHSEDLEKVKQSYEAKDEKSEIEYRIVVNKKIKWVNEKFYLVRDETHEEFRLIGITRDITDAKLIAEELEENRETLKLINTILRHDLTNDLTVILSALRLYSRTEENKYLSEIETSIRKSKNLIQRMNELEKTLSKEKEEEEYDLESTFTHILKNYPELDYKIKGNAEIKADKAVISVLDNIIQNVIFHAETDSISIRIEKENDYTIVRIADKGKGICEEIKSKIFEKRFSYGKSGKTGIGLYIVKKNLERYGAEISVEDNQPQGTIFQIKFKNN